VAIRCEVAGVQEQVEVQGRSTVIETTSTTISTTVGNAQIEKLPLGGRSVLVFAMLIPGAQQNASRTPGTTSPSARDSHINALRGQAFDEIQNEKLNANTPVNTARGVPKPRIRQHEFGFNAGGPIVRNRLFFFGNYEQIHVPGQTVLNRTVLTQEATQGIFR